MRLVSLLSIPMVLAATPTSLGQSPPPPAQNELAARLSFEAGSKGGVPTGWTGRPQGTASFDETTVHSGRGAARLQRDAQSPSEFTMLGMKIPKDFGGSRIELRGFLRTEEVVGGAALWLREDDGPNQLAFDGMARRQLKATNPWTQHSITLPLKAGAREIVFGAFLAGTGKVWVDDLELLVDGAPVWLAPRVARATILDTAHEFDGGSKIALASLTPIQVENLATLGRVWGFLKYHHPAATRGLRPWDYELFRILPGVVSSPDRASGLAALDKWVFGLGPVESCRPCAVLDAKAVALAPDLDWIGDVGMLGSSLSERLRAIHANRSPSGAQFYVALHEGIKNPAFDRESAHTNVALPDPGFQLLALFRFWNIIEYWSPYRDVIGEPWPGVLARFIPRVALARTRESYEVEMMQLIGAVNDTHANLWGSLGLRPPVGKCEVPVTVRFVEGKAVVAKVKAESEAAAEGLRLGDVIEELDGTPDSRWLEQWRPYYAASNEPTRLRDIARAFTRGPCGATSLRVLRDGQSVRVPAVRIESATPDKYTHDVPGETFRRISDKIAYLKLSSVKANDAARYVASAAGTTGLIIDIRNYPAEFMVFALGSLLVDRDTPFARFTRGDLVNPGAFLWDDTARLEPASPRYRGKVVILVDEVSQSSAEYTAMAFRASPRATVIGSTTAGADGNVSAIPLPGGLDTRISGIGVFYPNKKPTQRIGIIPDLEVRPTLAGVRAHRDEVLEAAIRHILGPQATPAEIQKLVATAYRTRAR